MPDQDSSGFSRLCPSCGRRVPRAVATCRCGAEMPPEEAVPVEAAPVEAAPQGFGGGTVLMAVFLTAALAGAGYWMFLRPAPDAALEELAAEDGAGDGAEPGSADQPERSAARRAWDAAASLGDAPLPSRAADSPAEAGPLSSSDLTPALEDMVDRAMPAIMLVETSGGRGSAFYVSRDTLITNVHVVQDDDYVTLRNMDGQSVTASVHTRAPAFDIAILKVSSSSSSQVVIPMGSARSLKPGQEVIVIGSALGTLQNSVSRGIVSGLRNSGGVTLVQTDAAANPGNSGGPMLDRTGRVVGITTAGYREQQGLNFAVSIDHARDILDGRPVSLGSNQRGLTDIKPIPRSGGPSESERRQQQGEQEFRAALSELGRAAQQLDTAWSRFRQQCYTSRISGSFDREWFAVLAPGALPGDAAAGCSDYYANMAGEIRKFGNHMRGAMSDARRAGVLPGTIRDALRQQRLQFEQWDR